MQLAVKMYNAPFFFSQRISIAHTKMNIHNNFFIYVKLGKLKYETNSMMIVSSFNLMQK